MDWDGFKERIKDQVDIVELISRDIPDLRQSGDRWRPEKEMDSLAVYPKTQSWFRFSTGKGGDIFDWVMTQHGLGFVEAAKKLAGDSGIEFPTGDGGYIEDERRRTFACLTYAARQMHKYLPTRIRRHLNKHYRINDETIDKLAIGWADGHLWHDLRDQFDPDTCMGTGLFIARKDPSQPLEFFEDRIVFPYWLQGQVVYAIARRTEYTSNEKHEKAKYKKLPTQSVKRPYVSSWISNEVFFNEDATKRRSEHLLITEGVTDAIAAIQANIPVISPVTTRFRSADHAKLRELTANAERIVICNDAEPPKEGHDLSPGMAGAITTARALWPDRDARIALLPRSTPDEKIDLNEYLAEHEPEDLLAIMRKAMRLPEWLVEQIPPKSEMAQVLPLLDDVLRAAAPLSELELGALFERIIKRLPQAGKRALRARLRELQGEVEEDEPDQPKAVISGEIHKGRGHYFTISTAGQPKIISNWVFEVEHRVEVENVELISGKAKTLSGKVIDMVFPPGAWSSRRQLTSALGRISPDLQWTGSDDNVQGLLAMLADDDVPTRAGASAIGWLDTANGPVWITPTQVIDKDGVIEGAPISYLSDGGPIDHRVDYRAEPDSTVQAAADMALANLDGLNEPHVILPVIGWFFAAPLREPLMQIMGHFPHLFIWGTPGCGKTELTRLFCRLSGYAGSGDPFSSSATEFSMMRTLSASRGWPVWFDEYKPSQMGPHRVARLHRFLQQLYGSEQESRGRADQTIRTYRLQAPAVISGEAVHEEQALMERAIVVGPRKQTVSEPWIAEQFAKVRDCDLGALALPLIKHALRTDVREVFVHARERFGGFISHSSPRIQDNLTVIMVGLLQWQDFARSMNVSVPDIERHLEQVIASQIEEIAPDGSTRNDLDRFLEACSVLATAKILEEDKHYAWIGGTLWIHMPGCRRVYLERQRSAGLGDETNGDKSLKRLAEESRESGGYVIDVSKRQPVGKMRLRCLGIETEKIPSGDGLGLDLDGFNPNPPASDHSESWS